MTTEQPQEIQPTEADLTSLAGKVEAFAATLTPAERVAFGEFMQRAVDGDDAQGYWFNDLFFRGPLINSPEVKVATPYYPPGTRTDAAR